MTANDRAAAERMLAQLKGKQEKEMQSLSRERLALITKMLLGYPQSNGDEHSGQARAELYLDALDDVSPHALQQALRQWSRGEAGSDHDYRWAPSPATLRRLCLDVWDRSQRDIQHLEDLLAAVSHERALNPNPLKIANPLVPTMKSI